MCFLESSDSWGFVLFPLCPPGDLDDKESACNTRDPGSISGSGRSPGERNGYPLLYSCLGNPKDRGVWQVIVHGIARSQT